MTSTELKTIFWNIGRDLTSTKLDLIDKIITSNSPDIFCIGEGTVSKINCQKIIDVFDKNNYDCYYSPLFSENKGLKPIYNYKRFGLKIFVSKNVNIKDSFSFAEQRIEGRIVILKIYHNFKPVTYIFLHNKSKGGGDDENLDQINFVGTLKEMITVGKIADNKERVVVIGDFNLEPWDGVLKHEKFLNTSIFPTRNIINQRNCKRDKYFYNPIIEFISNSKTYNLGGTYYSNNKGWALFDFILYDTNEGEVNFSIITKLNNDCELLNSNNRLKKNFLNFKLDHLPIISIINN